ncbi:nitroreductase family protein [Singulisphaera sp. PoT]|uniref:nitroreductase family protein n=1 Tax=Singulisphaera sp. PoT TaxID=3411797 RepID=UPI003BF4E0F0
MPAQTSPLDQTMPGLRSRRRFDPARPLPDPLLARILSLAALAPSWNDLQPARFLIVGDERNRRRLRTCVFDRREIVDAPVVVIVLGYLYPHETYLERFLAERLGLGQITPDEAARIRIMTRRKMERVDDLKAWSGLAAHRAGSALLIAAESLGVASAPVEEFDPAKVSKAFGIPDDHTPCALVALGYELEAEPPPPRLALRDLCYREHFGQPCDL